MPDENVVTPQPSPTPSPKAINWTTILIGVVIGAVFLGGGGYLVYNAYQPKKEEPTQTTTTTTKTATPSATTQTSKDETADWKVYTGKDFTFKYPQGYSVKVEVFDEQAGNTDYSITGSAGKVRFFNGGSYGYGGWKETRDGKVVDVDFDGQKVKSNEFMYIFSGDKDFSWIIFPQSYEGLNVSYGFEISKKFEKPTAQERSLLLKIVL